MSSLLHDAPDGDTGSGRKRGVRGRGPLESEPDSSSSGSLMSDDDIMKPKALMVGVGMDTAIARAQIPDPVAPPGAT